MQQILIPNVSHLIARFCPFEMPQAMITMGIRLMDVSCNIPVVFDNIIPLIVYLSYVYTCCSRFTKVVSGVFHCQQMKEANKQ